MLRIGRTVLALDEPVALALSDIEQGGDEPVAEEDLPPPPGAPSLPLVEEAPRSERRPGAAAPIAQVDAAARPAPRRKAKSGWSGTDLAVVVAALAVIALSVAGLVWLLRT